MRHGAAADSTPHTYTHTQEQLKSIIECVANDREQNISVDIFLLILRWDLSVILFYFVLVQHASM